MLNQVVRFAPVVQLVRELPAGTLLDVGSGSVGIAPWLPGWEVTAVDASFDDYGTAEGPAQDGVRRVLGDARELPFDERSFDVVVALDVLEHVTPADRARVLAELARVTSRRAIVGCPAGPAALESDRRLAERYRRRGQPEPGWIGEHLDNGFPEPEELAGGLTHAGTVRLLGNESLPAHELIMRAEAGRVSRYGAQVVEKTLGWAVRRDGRAGRLGAFALAAVRGGDRPPTYRTIAVLDR
jgi:SAM-dependent methyltransferase